MTDQLKKESLFHRLKYFSLFLVVVWTGCITASLLWNLHEQREKIVKIARNSAELTLEKDLIYRRWAAKQGGLYIPVSRHTPPNPYLNVTERDTTTSSGMPLTLVNPAYMTRQVNEMAADIHSHQSHLTSLNPIRPENTPDPWEAAALKSFERGIKDAISVEKIDGKGYLRFMRPFLTEKDCLRCHASQGYKEGDIRGGISVSIPMDPLWAIEKPLIIRISLAHLFLWIVGIAGIGMSKRRLDKQIVARETAEAVLSESERKLRIVADFTYDWEYWRSPDNRFLYISPSCERITGYTREEFMNDPGLYSRIIHMDDRDHVVAHLSEDPNTLELCELEFRILRRDGQERWIGHVCRVVRDANGQCLGRRASDRDITHRKQADEELKKTHAELEMRVQERTSDLSEAVERLRVENIQRKQLEATLRESENRVRFFASQYLTAQETERKRIAAELHDSIVASMAATKFRIENLAEQLKQGRVSPESMEDLASTIAEIVTDVRRIMADLRPSILDDLGILAAISWFCREYEKTYSQISVKRKIGVEEPEVPDSLKTPIFRICQEAMNNIAKHSQATLVNLSLRKEENKMLLTIQDNGQGFDLETVRKGMGLSTMRERAELSGGTFDLESTEGEGTIIRASWTV